jgi:anti-sigma factor RsiW
MHNPDSISKLMREHKEALRFGLPEGLELELRHEPRHRFSASPSVLALAACACVAISVLSFEAGRMMPAKAPSAAQEVVSGHVRSLMAGHLYDVKSTDQHTVKPWFEGKLDFGPVVRDFTPQGFALVGGRLDYVGGRAVAALVYQHGQHFINVYEWPALEQGDTAPRLSTDRGFQLFDWRARGIAYWVVSDVNAADLQSLAQELATN